MAFSTPNPNGQAIRNNSTPVVLATEQETILSGLATQTTLAAMNSKLPAQGATNAANSQPVTISTETATGNITTQNLVPNGVATANSAVEITLNGATGLGVQVTGTYTGALSIQLTIDGNRWETVTSTSLVNAITGVPTATIASATQGIFQAEVTGFARARITGLAAMTGTATVTLRTTSSSGVISLDNALPTGANTIGAVTISGTPTVGLAASSVIIPVGSTAQGAATYFTLVSAATNNLTQVKAGATTVNSLQVSNSNATTGRYLKIFNALSASVIMGTTNATLNYFIPPNSSISIDTGSFGIRFATGFTIAVTSGIALNDNTAAVASEVTVSTSYF